MVTGMTYLKRLSQRYPSDEDLKRKISILKLKEERKRRVKKIKCFFNKIKYYCLKQLDFNESFEKSFTSKIVVNYKHFDFYKNKTWLSATFRIRYSIVGGGYYVYYNERKVFEILKGKANKVIFEKIISAHKPNKKSLEESRAMVQQGIDNMHLPGSKRLINIL